MTTLILIFAVFAQAGKDPVFSGPQKGEKTPGFKVLDLNGDAAGKEADHLAEWKGAPAAICFIHELTRPAAQLMRRLDQYGAEHADALKTLFVFLSDDPSQGERRFPISLKSLGMKSLAGVSVDGKEGPGAYGLNKEMTLTVIIARDNAVIANWAILSPNETDFPRIEIELDKLTAPALATPDEMRVEILRLRRELAALKREMEGLKSGRPADSPRRMERMDRAEATPRSGEKDKEAAAPPDDPRLAGLLRRTIRLDAEKTDIDQALQEIEALIKENAALKRQLLDKFQAIEKAGYGSDYSKEARKKLQEKLKQ